MIDFLTTPNGTDIAYNWITAVFPTDPKQPYGQAFAVFTSALTFIGALFMGWHIIIGIVSSAYSGKVLGERYHQIWAPLRVVLGFGMLVPIAGGFSTVHYLLRDVVGVAAVQMANLPIKTYIEGMADRNTDIQVSAMNGKQLAETILDFQTCAAVVNGINTVVDPWLGGGASANISPSATTLSITAGGSVKSGSTWNFGDCGTLIFFEPGAEGEFLKDQGPKLKEFNDKRAAATTKMMADLLAGFNPGEFGKFFATKDYKENMGPQHAIELRNAGIIQAGLPDRISAAAREWNATVGAAAQQVYADASTGNQAKLLERINTYGFMVAGSYERTLSQMSGLVIRLANDAPKSTLSNPGRLRYGDAYHGGLEAMAEAKRTESARTLAEGEQPSAEDGLSYLDQALSWVAPSMYNMKRADPTAPIGDPVGDMISMGHTLVAGAQSGIIAMALANGASEGVGNSAAAWVGVGGFAAGIVSYLASWAGYVIMISLIVGIMHAYILPMLPMIMVFVMGISWLVLFLEAAIAGVLWAFAFIRMDGNDFFDKNQSPGVTLLFNLFLRPAIGMLAFIGGLLLLPQVLHGLILVWDDSFYVQTGDVSFTFVVQWLVGLVMFTWMQWHLTLRLYGLVPTIADRVGHWMGFQSHGYNDGQETTAAIGAMVAAGAAVTKAPVMRPGGGGGGAGRMAPGLPQGGKPGAASKSDVRSMSGNNFDPGKSKKTTK